MIAWFARNGVAANLLMAAILVGGVHSVASRLVLEVFPEFELDLVRIQVSYRGASPAEVEEGMVLKIEEAIGDLVGIKEIRSTCGEGNGAVTVEVEPGKNPRNLLDDIKNRVDAISTFPVDAERPVYSIAKRLREVIAVAVFGNVPEKELRRLGERVRDDLTALRGVSQVELTEVRPYEIAIEVSEARLQKYGLTFDHVVREVRRSSLDLPAGTLRTAGGQIRLRTRGQSYTGSEFENLVIVRRPDGVRINLGQIATVTDGFDETPLEARFNGKPCVLLEVYRVGSQNAIELAAAVRAYVERAGSTLPPGAEIAYWRDRSIIIEKRLGTLVGNAIQGWVLVLVLLGLFLRPSVAFWVFWGIPMSFLGALAVMPLLGVSVNLMSLFAFILVLGIVVDDAIVVGENIYTHLQKGEGGEQAAIAGVQEVSVPVVFGVLTTVVAFVPLMMMQGRRGPIFAQIPLIVIPVLLFSLLESKLILPAHLKHVRAGAADRPGGFRRAQEWIAGGLERLAFFLYRPVLRFALRRPVLVIATFTGILAVIGSAVLAGHVRFVYFPRIQSEVARATLVMSPGTSFEVTRREILRISAAAETLRERFVDPATGQSVIKDILATTGSTGGSWDRGAGAPESHVGRVMFEIVPPEDRTMSVTSSQLVNEWRRLIGPVAGARDLNFKAEIGRTSDPIDVQLIGNDVEKLRRLADAIKSRLAGYPGVFDISDSFDRGKQEIQLRLKPGAELLDVRLADLGEQVRQGFFGAEAQRIQRGRDDLRVMVRFPLAERTSFGYLESMFVRTSRGKEVPFHEVAEARMGTGVATIHRINRRRTISVIADLDKRNVDARAIYTDLRKYLSGLVERHPDVRFELAGEAREQKESLGSLIVGLFLVLFAIYALLAVPFKSYLQPLVVMAVIPFGWGAAVVGHLIMGMDLSFSSLLGMLALTGVVVNDSLVMIDFINSRRAAGASVAEAVGEAGVARFRAILLTSITTFAGLTPLILEKSTQAQFLIPMAVSLGFGVMLTTFVTLLLVPVGYVMLEKAIAAARIVKRWVWDLY